jgi:hypothetical protein
MTVVHDPFDVATDPKLAFLAEALDPSTAQCVLRQHLPAFADKLVLRAIRVVRHKPGRRCLIAYDLDVCTGGEPTTVTLLGKVRARGLDEHTYRLHRALWQAGWNDAGDDRISVPEAVGIVPEWHMWLQRHVPGEVATTVLRGPNGVMLAHRIAEIAHKLHNVDIRPRREHTIGDELRILHERLERVVEQRPDWRQRLRCMLDACERLGATITPTRLCGIHRDFYADQVLVDGERLRLIDLDLYCAGDPGLDIGNFIAHIVEDSLRTFGTPDALADRATALEERFVALAGEEVRPSIHAYTTLTLVRHISISTQFAARRPFTARLLNLCEQRLKPYLR